MKEKEEETPECASDTAVIFLGPEHEVAALAVALAVIALRVLLNRYL